MGADARFKAAKEARERNQFDASLAQAVKNSDERALPSDMFGLTISPGTLIMHFPQSPTPPPMLVTDIDMGLDRRAPPGMLKMRCVVDLFLPAGTPNPSLIVVGAAPTEESTKPKPVEADVPLQFEDPPSLVLTDTN